MKKADPNLAAKEAKAEAAKNDLTKYIFHFERYHNHEKSEKIAAKEKTGM